MTDSLSLYRYVIPDTSGIPIAHRIRTQEEITPQSIKMAMAEWKMFETRFEQLFYYYLGITPKSIYNEKLDYQTDKNNRIISNYCGYIVKTIKGYIAGNQPDYEYAVDDSYGKAICDLFKEQNKAEVDAQIIQDMSIYGKAFELVYMDDDGQPQSTVISPRDAFVAYSGDVAEDSVFGAVRYAIPLDTGETLFRLYLYTREEVQIWESTSSDDSWSLKESKPHAFGRVPLIEYNNNDTNYPTSDFEGIIALQNLYNRTLINRVADKDAFVKSILLVMGSVVGRTHEEISEAVQNLNADRVLQLDEDSSAQFLEHSMDETGVQVLQDQIKNDIHKFAFVPDLSDEQFSNNASGVAMAYKLFGTSQIVVEKDNNFQKGFVRRCKLYDAVLYNSAMNQDYEPVSIISKMRCVFKYNTPQDLSYMASAFAQLVPAGILSKDTARQNLSIILDAEAEKEKIEEEANADAEKQRLAFESDYSTTPANMEQNPDLNDTEKQDNTDEA